jgi:hypothetical protein
VFDIDGVVADVRHRLPFLDRRPKDWEGFFGAAKDDKPLPDGLRRFAELAAVHDVAFLTGRPERLRPATAAWLERVGLGGHALHMRGNDDHRPARLLKRRALDRLARTSTIAVVVDDDPAVCAALAAAGYTVERADWMERTDTLFAAQEREGRT